MGHMKILKFKLLINCKLNEQGAREDFWIFYLDTLHPKGLNEKRTLKY